VLANCLEAVIGAVYLDGGLAAVAECIDELFSGVLRGSDVPERRDVKTRFQEWAHEKLRDTPAYRTVRDSGTENDPARFSVEVVVAGEIWGHGTGRSKREAERGAATAALARVAGIHG
jgi:ribonuclease-3